MSNTEIYLAALAGTYSGELPAPEPLRQEMYLAKMAGAYDGELPEPVTREDVYLYGLALNGTGGGGKISNVKYLFYQGNRMSELDTVLSMIETPVTSVEHMFSSVTATTDAIDLSKMDFSALTAVDKMFYSSSGVKNVILGELPVGVMSIASTFYGCSKLETVTGTFEHGDPVDAEFHFDRVFENCKVLKSQNLLEELGKARPGQHITLSHTFSGCTALDGEIDLANFTVSSAGNFLLKCTKVTAVLNVKMHKYGTAQSYAATFAPTCYGTASAPSALRRLTFREDSSPLSGNLDLSYCSFDLDGLTELFNTIPKGTGQLIITGNPGVTGTLTIAEGHYDCDPDNPTNLCEFIRARHLESCAVTTAIDGVEQEKTGQEWLDYFGEKDVGIKTYIHWEAGTATGLDVLTDDIRAIATGKGWTITE